MTYTIRDNNGNVVFSVENVNPEVSYESINTEFKNIEEYSNKLNKSIEAFNLISNTKAMESFGYRATEGFGEKVKATGKAIWEKIKVYLNKVVGFFRIVINNINKKLNKVTAKSEAAIIVKKLKNPNLEKDRISEELEKLINSDDIGLYVVIEKNFSLITKFFEDEVVRKVALSDKEKNKFNEAIEKIKNIKESASKVDPTEKRVYAVDFYKDVASNGLDKIESEVKTLEYGAYKQKQNFEKNIDLDTLDGQGYYSRVYSYITAVYGLTVEFTKIVYKLCSMLPIAASIVNSNNENNNTDAQ